MFLNELLNDCEITEFIGKLDINIENLSQNSKINAKNTLFFALNGTKTDGRLYVTEAKKNGAVAVVVEKPCKENITQIVVKNVRKAMAIISANFYDNPQNKLKIIGITGTNGKTSCTYILGQMLQSIGKNVGIIGTNGIYFNNKRYESDMTTPDSIELFAIFAKMTNAGVEYCVMEVSAHAIYFDKIFGIDFAVKALTNVSFDHLDFFKTKKEYQKMKEKFFENGDNFVLNADDVVSLKISKNIQKTGKNGKKMIVFGENSDNLQRSNEKCSVGGTNFDLSYQSKIYHIKTQLVGLFNVQNMCLAIGTLLLLQFDIDQIIDAVKSVKNLPGRFDTVQNKFNIPIIIDYAHTYESLNVFLREVVSLSQNKNIIVFGAPGERDTTKRLPMGELAGRFCDYVFVTSDNPASENPRRIAFEILQGAKKTKTICFFEENRKKCIKKAINLAKKQKKCNVLIVGKGIETCQVVGDKHKKYSDYQSVFDAIKSFK